MAFLRPSLAPESVPVLRGSGLFMRPPVSADYAAWAELRALSRDHLTPFEPTWARDELSRGAFRRRLRHYQREQREDLGVSFFIFDKHGSELLGGLTVSNIRRGVTQAAAIGYWIGLPHAGKGYMTNAVALVADYAFEDLSLHRLEAACLPQNRASIGVLERNGFQREGTLRRYLRIDGAWRDHLFFGLLAEDQRPDRELA
ncbi:MAG: GNAT family N-acetyltransferase [Hyphomicrobiaceae bacterium]|nr:GNAT family N-acetyltransferase [Hyphomicrobiaceae bacterium]